MLPLCLLYLRMNRIFGDTPQPRSKFRTLTIRLDHLKNPPFFTTNQPPHLLSLVPTTSFPKYVRSSWSHYRRPPAIVSPLAARTPRWLPSRQPPASQVTPATQTTLQMKNRLASRQFTIKGDPGPSCYALTEQETSKFSILFLVTP
jgi:hypothetical protein